MNSHFNSILIYVILFVVFACFQSTSSQILDTVVSCSGFVRLSSEFENYKPDLSEIKIFAKTPSGITKETADCSPNGFYLLPIYDLGTYLLEVQGPQGWSIEPKSTSITVENGSCNEGNDINFIITGFSIFGNVKTEKNEGISNVGVTLQDKQGNTLVTSTSTSSGAYSFSNVKPGDYNIVFHHNSWTLSKAQLGVKVPCGNLNVDEDIVVTGYDLSGSVLSVGGQPMAGVDFTLYKGDEKFKAVNSNAEGKFQMNNIPCGKYDVVASYLSETTTFEVSPSKVSVSICGASFFLEEPFRVVGFSVIGKVMNGKEGIAGVKIFVNGAEKTTTNSGGDFTWEKANEGDYTITASKEHFEFSSLTNIHISPSNYQLQDLQVEKYHICGKLNVDKSFPNYLKVREITVKNLVDNQSYNVKTSTEGDYCFFEKPGQYLIRPVQAEESKGLLFTPGEKTLQLTNSPILNQDFQQAKVTVSGSVLPQIDSNYEVVVKLVDFHTKQVKQSTKVDSNSNFQFTNVFPGTYLAEVDYDKWCWESTSTQLNIKTEDVNNVKFRRTGYKLAFNVNADVKLIFENTQSEKEFSQGKHEICLPELTGTSEYVIKPVSCFKFEQEKYVIDVKKSAYPQVVEFNFSHIKVTGKISTDQADSSLSISVKSNKIQNVEASIVNTKEREYVYEFWALPGDSLTITPTSENILFYPQSISVSVHNFAKCMDEIPTFEGRKGKYYEGNIEPLLVDVQISVFSKDSKQAIAVVRSDEKGHFVAGPLYDDIQYELTAFLEGYNFVKSGDNFVAIELAKLTIRVLDSDKNLIQGGVLLSLTSDEGYRTSNVTNIETGSFTFEELFPGKYYLKPLLKEYTFTPSNVQIQIDAGSDIVKEIYAQRVAFSCFGSVKSLNLFPEKSVPIQARSIDGTEIEETQSDENGNFRIRGLKPGKEYIVSIKAGGKIDRTSPSSYRYVVPTDDIRDANFIAFRKFNRYEVTGVVNTNQKEWISTLHVQLFSEKNTDVPVRTFKLGPSNVFNFPLLPKEEYFIRLNTTLSPKIYDFKIEDIPVVFDSDITTLEINFTADFHIYDSEIAHTPFYYLIFLVCLVLSYMYKKPLLELWQKFQTGKWNEDEQIALEGKKKPGRK